MDTTSASEMVLNPSFLVPAFYASAVINIISVYIVIRLVGAVRKILKKLGDDSTIILQNVEDNNSNVSENNNNVEQNIDKKEDLF